MNSQYSTDQCHSHFQMSGFQLQSKGGIETREEVSGVSEGGGGEWWTVEERSGQLAKQDGLIKGWPFVGS
jgi:hypothetical protein